jgi:hypothetical protein
MDRTYCIPENSFYLVSILSPLAGHTSHHYFLCPNLGSLMKTVITTVTSDKMTVIMKVALSAEA